MWMPVDCEEKRDDTIFGRGPSNQRAVIQVTDGWVARSDNQIGMISRSALRRSLSFVLSLVIILWADTGLAVLPASGHGAKCQVRMVQMHQRAAHCAAQSATLATALGCYHQRTHSMPCCPPQPVPAPTPCGDHSGCCDMSSQPARPLAFLVASGNSLSLQLSANGPAGAILLPALSRSAFLASDHSPQFVRPVFGRKTDLRI